MYKIRGALIQLLKSCKDGKMYVRDIMQLRSRLKINGVPLQMLFDAVLDLCKSGILRVKKLRDGTDRIKIKLAPAAA